MADIADLDLLRSIAEAQARERRGIEHLGALTRLDELRRRFGAADEAVVQLAVRLPLPLRQAVRQAARLTGTSVQDWVAQALTDAVERASDPNVRAATRLADEIRVRWRDGLDLDAYAEEVAATDDGDLTNV